MKLPSHDAVLFETCLVIQTQKNQVHLTVQNKSDFSSETHSLTDGTTVGLSILLKGDLQTGGAGD